MNIQLSGFININKLYDRRLSFSIYYNYVNWLIVIMNPGQNARGQNARGKNARGQNASEQNARGQNARK